MKPIRFLTLLAALVLAGCATNPAERTRAQLERYLAAAGEPVGSFRYFTFNSWTPLGKEYLAVWTKPREAWLIQVMPLCHDLDFAQNIGLSSSLNRVYARFDKVIVRDYTCRIKSIRPVDVAMLKDLQHEARLIEARNSDQPYPGEEGDAAR